jgi:RNA-directed DNA polymerase
MALPGMEEAITRGSPQARVSASADEGVGLHEDRQGLEPCQERLRAWLAEMGRPLHAAKSRLRHTWEGAQPGGELLGLHIRQYRVGTHPAGQGPRGSGRLGSTTLLTPAQANVQAPLAELGRVMHRGKALPLGQLMHQRTPQIRGWAHSDRTGVSQAVYDRLEHLTWAQLRRWALWRHPKQSAAGAIKRSWQR